MEQASATICRAGLRRGNTAYTHAGGRFQIEFASLPEKMSLLNEGRVELLGI